MRDPTKSDPIAMNQGPVCNQSGYAKHKNLLKKYFKFIQWNCNFYGYTSGRNCKKKILRSRRNSASTNITDTPSLQQLASAKYFYTSFTP